MDQPNIPQPTPPQTPSDNTSLDPKVVRMAKAIRQVESNNNFNAVGDQGTSKGAYQFHNDHFEKWATQFGLDPHDFSPENQNHLAYLKIKQLKDEGRQPDEIAAIWNGSHLENGKYVANNPAYVKKVKAAYDQIPDYKPTPAFTPTPFTSGQIDIPASPSVTANANPKHVGKGILNSIGNFATGLVKGTGQVLQAPAKMIAPRIDKFLGVSDDTIKGTNQQLDQTFIPKGTSQKVGAFVGRDVLPATAALTTGAAGLTGLGADVPSITGAAKGKVGGLIGKALKAYGVYEVVKHSPVKGLLKILLDL